MLSQQSIQKDLFFIFFEGLSFTSKLIRWWTRSKFSHSGFVNDKIVSIGNKGSFYKYGALIEAWKKPNESLFAMRTMNSSFANHTKRTPFKVLRLKVSLEQYEKVHEFQRICAYLQVPYDWKAIVAFVVPFKLKRNGYLFCSEKDCLSLKYAGVLPDEIQCWKTSPDRLYALLRAEGADLVYEDTT